MAGQVYGFVAAQWARCMAEWARAYCRWEWNAKAHRSRERPTQQAAAAMVLVLLLIRGASPFSTWLQGQAGGPWKTLYRPLLIRATEARGHARKGSLERGQGSR